MGGREEGRRAGFTVHGRAEQSRRIEEQNNEHVRVEEGWGVDRSKYYDQRRAGKMLCGGEKKQERVERTTRQAPAQSGRRALHRNTS